MLKLFWFCIKAPLPCELPGETVSQPNVNINNMISVIHIKFASFHNISTSEISMH
jgi:hypothetical protein